MEIGSCSDARSGVGRLEDGVAIAALAWIAARIVRIESETGNGVVKRTTEWARATQLAKLR